MGSSNTKVQPKPRNPEKLTFGGYKNAETPRPGYYVTPTDVYYRGSVMENVSPADFQKLGNGWAVDKKNVYFQGKRVEGADRHTFRVENKFGKDKKFKWYKGKKVPE